MSYSTTVNNRYWINRNLGRRLSLFGLILLLMILFMMPGQAQAASVRGRTARVVCGGVPLKVRSGPSTSCRIKTSLRSGARVTLIKKVDEWYLVRCKNNIRGYCYGLYLKLEAKGAGKKNGGGNANNGGKNSSGVLCQVTKGDMPLKLRKSTSTASNILANIPRGRWIRIKGYYSSGWYKACWRGKTGYVSADYVILGKGVRIGKQIPRLGYQKNGGSGNGTGNGNGSGNGAGNGNGSGNGTGNGTISARIKKTLIGRSGQGRKIYSYRVGSGSNHIVITAGVHAWEDSWERDSYPITQTALRLVRHCARNIKTLNRYNYSVIVIPRVNPDGYFDGYSHNGPGRCTTRRFNNAGKLIAGGVDLNRCFPLGFLPAYESRNFTGDKPLGAREAVIVKNWLNNNMGSGTNIYIDMHGWYNQTITVQKGYGQLYKAFAKYFTRTRPETFAGANGYIVRYAGSLGYHAVLFEFPHASNTSYFFNMKYDRKFIRSVMEMVKTIE